MAERGDVSELARLLGYADGASGRLLVAVTHTSFANEAEDPTEHNERLEFLGDAVLGLLVADALMEAHPSLEEGRLSRLRASLVNAKSLADVARDHLDLGRLLRLGRGEQQSGGRSKDSLLADAYEAVLGAVYLDLGLPAAEHLVRAHLGRQIADLEVRAAHRDYKTTLQELVQARFRTRPEYVVVGEEGPDHEKLFEVSLRVCGEEVARGRGRSKKTASRAAAREACLVYRGADDLPQS